MSSMLKISPAQEMDAVTESVRILWEKAVQADGHPATVQFVVLSQGNPYRTMYDQAMARLLQLRRYSAGRTGSGRHVRARRS